MTIIDYDAALREAFADLDRMSCSRFDRLVGLAVDLQADMERLAIGANQSRGTIRRFYGGIHARIEEKEIIDTRWSDMPPLIPLTGEQIIRLSKKGGVTIELEDT